MLSNQLAKQLREVHFGGNWTAVNLRDVLADVSRDQAVQRRSHLHSIAELVFHMNYFVRAVLSVERGGPLEAHDKFSFDLPRLQSEIDWQNLLDKTWADAEELASRIAQIPDTGLWEDFAEAKHGTRFRNFQGLIEHCHYHLGQIVILKKMLDGTA